MSLYILRWNPNISSYKTDDHLNVIRGLKVKCLPIDFDWSIHESEQLKKDDIFILQQVGTDNDGIAMIGKFKDKCYEGESWRDDGSKTFYADMWIMDAIDCNSENILSASRYEKLFPEIKWHGGYSGVVVEEKLADKLLKAINEDMIKNGKWNENEFNNFVSKDFNKAFPYIDNKCPSPEELKDGKCLIELTKQFLEKNNRANLYQLCHCLYDSEVCIPLRMEISEDDKKKIADNYDKGIKESEFKKGTKLFPIMLTSDECDTGFPVFSNADEMGNNYDDVDHAIYQLSFLECIKIAKSIKGCNALVLDAFTTSFVIDMDFADSILHLKDLIE